MSMLNIEPGGIESEGEGNVADVSSISDGYHTFGELYEHRHALFIALMASHPEFAWYSLTHNDEGNTPCYEGYFIAGINIPIKTNSITPFHRWPWTQVSYHLPIKYLETVRAFYPQSHQPKYDGHTSDDVINRILNWVKGDYYYDHAV